MTSEVTKRKFDDNAKKVFLETLADIGELGIAAAEAGFTLPHINYYRRSDPEFAEQTELAWQKFRKKVRQLCWDHAFVGKPVYSFSNGRKDEYKREYNHRLQELELKRTHPHEYNETVKVTDDSREYVPVEREYDFSQLSLQERKHLAELLSKSEKSAPVTIDQAPEYNIRRGNRIIDGRN